MSEHESEESDRLAVDALRGLRELRVDPPEPTERAATRRKVVGRMQELMREEQAKRARRRRVSIAVLVAAVICLSAASAFGLRAFGTRSTAPAPRLSRVTPLFVRALSTQPVAAPAPSNAASDSSAKEPNPSTSGTPSHPAEAASVASPPSSSKPSAARPAEAETPASQLAEQNRLFQAAMAARKSGDDRRVVQLCDELLRRYPSSPLAAVAESERASASARLSHAP